MNSIDVLKVLQARIGSADWSKWQIQRWQYYDYVRYPAAGTTELTFFANPLGSTDPNSALAKTLEQTNMNKARSFGQVYYIVQQIRTHISVIPRTRQVANITNQAAYLFGTDMTALANQLQALSHQGVLFIEIGQKEYFDIEQPFTQTPPGFGLNIIQHASSGIATASKLFQQSPNAEDVYAVSPPQLIEPEQTFDVSIEFPNSASPDISGLTGPPKIDIGVIFDGYIARPAQ